MASTKDVLDHHLKCFGEGDLKGILSDYAPGAVLFTPDGPLKGSEGTNDNLLSGLPGTISSQGAGGSYPGSSRRYREGTSRSRTTSADPTRSHYRLTASVLLVTAFGRSGF
jgi:hypothetical protein